MRSPSRKTRSPAPWPAKSYRAVTKMARFEEAERGLGGGGGGFFLAAMAAMELGVEAENEFEEIPPEGCRSRLK